MRKFHVEIVYIQDPGTDSAWPNAVSVRRFALLDDRNVVWVNKHPFGFLVHMMATDHSTSDCRYLLRKTPFEAWGDAPPLGQDEEYYKETVFG